MFILSIAAVVVFLASLAFAKELYVHTCSPQFPLVFRQTCDRHDVPELYVHGVLRSVIAEPSVSQQLFESDYVYPWSYRPYCAGSANGTEQICLFTSLNFAGGRGISLITTPHDAALIAETEAFVNAKSALRDVNLDRRPRYETQQLPGRGIGLIANTTLQRGDLIFAHTPVLAINDRVQKIISLSDLGLLQRGGIARLPQASREQFLALHGHFGGDPVDDIINTNSFDVELGKAEDSHYVVLPETSRLNHDCRPNAQYYLDPSTLSHHVHAVRTIHPGEEITVSYLDPSMSRADRRDKLKRTWGFDCNCSRCTQPRVFTDASDSRLNIIGQLIEALSNRTIHRTATTRDAELLVNLMKQERLDAVLADAYTYAALEYSYVGDKQNTIKYAAQAIESGILYAGPGTEDLTNMHELLDTPEAHWSWLYFQKQRERSTLRADNGH